MKVKNDVVIESQRETPVAKRAEVLVVGGSPTGVSAAVAAARNGADVLLVERFGILGGTTTAGLVFTHGKRLLYDRSGHRIVDGLNWEMIERALRYGGAEAAWEGDADWEWYGTYIDPEVLKLVLMEMLDEAGVRLLLHSLVVDTIVEDGALRGVVVENKSGRQAILATMAVDATGDGDVAARAGAPFQHRGRACRRPGLHSILGQVEIEKVLAYLDQNPEQFRGQPVRTVAELRERIQRGWSWGIHGFYDLIQQAIEDGILEEADGRGGRGRGFLWMRDGLVQVWSISPDGDVDMLDVDDLTLAEVQSRGRLSRIVRFFQCYVPGFEAAKLVLTPFHMGVRETRQIQGEYVLTPEDVHASRQFPDAITLCAGHDEADNVEKGFGIPYRCLVPLGVENLLVAGRCISAEAPVAHHGIRGIIPGVSTGEASGTAAAMAVRAGISPREVDVPTLRQKLKDQGVILDLSP